MRADFDMEACARISVRVLTVLLGLRMLNCAADFCLTWMMDSILDFCHLIWSL